MDEAGIMEGLGENGLVGGNSESRTIHKKRPGSRDCGKWLEKVFIPRTKASDPTECKSLVFVTVTVGGGFQSQNSA